MVEFKSLDELVGQVTDRIVSNKNPDMPYIGLEHIEQGRPALVGIAASTESTSTNTVFQSGDILFGKLRPNLRKSLQVKFDGYCSTDIIVLRAHEGVVSQFAAKVFQQESVFRRAVQTAIGTKMPRTSWDEIKPLKVFVPSSDEEQRAIAAILYAIDDAIRHTEALIDKLKLVRAGLLHDLLTCGLDENGELRDPLAHPEQFKDSELGLIPRDWECLTIGDCMEHGWIVDVQDGNHGERHPKSNDFVQDGIPFVTAKDIVNGWIDFEGCNRISREQYLSLRVGFSISGDVILTHKGTVGLTAIVPYDVPEIMLSPQTTYYRISGQGSILPAFLRMYFDGDSFQRRINILAAQTTRLFVGITMQKTLRILTPSTTEQKAISSFLDSCSKQVDIEMDYHEKLKMVKQGLMDDLLTGRVRVSVVA